MNSNKIKITLLLLFMGMIALISNGCPCPCGSSPPNFITSLWYDAPSDELYVLKDNQILVFNKASTVNGHLSPNRIILMPKTYAPGSYCSYCVPAMWFDSASNELFVLSKYAASVLVFTDATTANGNVTPARVISGTTTELNWPSNLWFDAHSNQLYVNNSYNILVFTDATTAQGNIAPTRVISSTTTTPKANVPASLWLDSTSNQLYVGITNNSILVFTDASTVSGTVAPARTITSTALYALPRWLWFDTISNQLYVATGYGGILAFTDATTINGNITPAKIISANQFIYNGPLWLDSASDELYVANQDSKGHVSILVFDNASSINGSVTPSRVLYP